MEVVLLIGLPASGKSSFYAERFGQTHLRLNLDMLRTRRREMELFTTCLRLRQSLVVDNTNVSGAERARFLDPARAAGVPVMGYYFHSDADLCVARNAARPGRSRIPDAGIWAAVGRLEPPKVAEGFAGLHRVRLGARGFTVRATR